jgi:hypothetical protein
LKRNFGKRIDENPWLVGLENVNLRRDLIWQVIDLR